MAEEQDQVARDVETLAQLEREIVGVWLPRLADAADAARRLDDAGQAGAEQAWDEIVGFSDVGALPALHRVIDSVREYFEGEGDDVWYRALFCADATSHAQRGLRSKLLEAGRARFTAELRSLPAAAQASVLYWLGDYGAHADAPPAARTLYEAVTGSELDNAERSERNCLGEDNFCPRYAVLG